MAKRSKSKAKCTTRKAKALRKARIARQAPRLDTTRLFRALNMARIERHYSWRDCAKVMQIAHDFSIDLLNGQQPKPAKRRLFATFLKISLEQLNAVFGVKS